MFALDSLWAPHGRRSEQQRLMCELPASGCPSHLPLHLSDLSRTICQTQSHCFCDLIHTRVVRSAEPSDGGSLLPRPAFFSMITACTLVQVGQFSLISSIISVGMPHYKS